MTAAPDFTERRFQSAAAHYLAGRPRYAPLLIERVAALVGLSQADGLLDLGCGPAQLAVAFAPWAGRIIAMDPEPAMLALARSMTLHLKNVEVRAGSSNDLGDALGPLRVVTIGRAFHWMDRPSTLATLDALLAPGAAIVLFWDERLRVATNEWLKDYDAIIERYSADDPERARHKSDEFTSHLSVILQSPFNQVERFSVVETMPVDEATLIDRALSLSSTSRARLGDRADAMVEEIHTFMRRVAGTPVQAVMTNALIARRPQD